MVASIFLRIFAYAVPIIMILLGIIAKMGGELAKIIFGGVIPPNFWFFLIFGGLIILIIEWRFGIH